MEQENKDILVVISNNWADEFDVHTIRRVNREEWKAYRQRVEANAGKFGPVEDWFGTNEFVKYYEPSEFFECVTELEIPAGASDNWVDKITHGPLDLWLYEQLDVYDKIINAEVDEKLVVDKAA